MLGVAERKALEDAGNAAAWLHKAKMEHEQALRIAKDAELQRIQKRTLDTKVVKEEELDEALLYAAAEEASAAHEGTVTAETRATLESEAIIEASEAAAAARARAAVLRQAEQAAESSARSAGLLRAALSGLSNGYPRYDEDAEQAAQTLASIEAGAELLFGTAGATGASGATGATGGASGADFFVADGDAAEFADAADLYAASGGGTGGGTGGTGGTGGSTGGTGGTGVDWGFPTGVEGATGGWFDADYEAGVLRDAEAAAEEAAAAARAAKENVHPAALNAATATRKHVESVAALHSAQQALSDATAALSAAEFDHDNQVESQAAFTRAKKHVEEIVVDARAALAAANQNLDVARSAVEQTSAGLASAVESEKEARMIADSATYVAKAAHQRSSDVLAFSQTLDQSVEFSGATAGSSGGEGMTIGEQLDAAEVTPDSPVVEIHAAITANQASAAVEKSVQATRDAAVASSKARDAKRHLSTAVTAVEVATARLNAVLHLAASPMTTASLRDSIVVDNHAREMTAKASHSLELLEAEEAVAATALIRASEEAVTATSERQAEAQFRVDDARRVLDKAEVRYPTHPKQTPNQTPTVHCDETVT